jgi:predicted NAD/FAD-binding protein
MGVSWGFSPYSVGPNPPPHQKRACGRFETPGTAIGLFAQPRNLLSPSYLWMLRDILTLQPAERRELRRGKLAGLSLGDCFRTRHFAPRLLGDYFAPMGAAIWSASASEMLDFPAENFVAFRQSPPAAI